MQHISRLWGSGRAGKLTVGCGGAIVLLLICAICSVLVPGSRIPQADRTLTPVSAALGTNVTVILAPPSTNTLTPTKIPSAVSPTATPTRTNTPVPPTPTRTNTPVPPTPTYAPPTPTVPSAPRVVIAAINPSGRDEYVTVTNRGGADQDLSRWTIQSYSERTCQPEPNQIFLFPPGYVLAAGTSVRVHSGQGAIDNPPSDLLWTRDYIWNNNGDRGDLRTPDGQVVSSYAYGSCR